MLVANKPMARCSSLVAGAEGPSPGLQIDYGRPRRPNLGICKPRGSRRRREAASPQAARRARTLPGAGQAREGVACHPKRQSSGRFARRISDYRSRRSAEAPTVRALAFARTSRHAPGRVYGALVSPTRVDRVRHLIIVSVATRRESRVALFAMMSEIHPMLVANKPMARCSSLVAGAEGPSPGLQIDYGRPRRRNLGICKPRGSRRRREAG
jgi:hypothetical protein